jgi:muconate cycloisomerase
MKITRITATPIHVPLVPELTTKTAHGEHITSPYVIVEIETDTGLIGLGEATVAPRWSGETRTGCLAAIDELIGPAIMGIDPRDTDAAWERIDGVIRFNPFTKAAVEMAVWDLAGKAQNAPVYELLGGKVRESAPIKMVVGAFDVEKAVGLASRFLDWGVNTLKVKVGLDAASDLARFEAVRELAGADVPIGFDANCGWDTDTAVQMMAALNEFDVLFAEQPIAAGDPQALAALRQQTEIPIMADESCFTLADAVQLVRHQAADILAVYPGKHGGLTETRRITEVAREAGIVCAMGSNLELGIGTAAMLHLAMADPTIDSERYPADLIGPLYHQADLITEPLTLGPEVATVPDRPGLGVELDRDQLERYREETPPSIESMPG